MKSKVACVLVVCLPPQWPLVRGGASSHFFLHWGDIFLWLNVCIRICNCLCTEWSSTKVTHEVSYVPPVSTGQRQSKQAVHRFLHSTLYCHRLSLSSLSISLHCTILSISLHSTAVHWSHVHYNCARWDGIFLQLNLCTCICIYICNLICICICIVVQCKCAIVQAEAIFFCGSMSAFCLK